MEELAVIKRPKLLEATPQPIQFMRTSSLRLVFLNPPQKIKSILSTLLQNIMFVYEDS